MACSGADVSPVNSVYLADDSDKMPSLLSGENQLYRGGSRSACLKSWAVSLARDGVAAKADFSNFLRNLRRNFGQYNCVTGSK
jgi:hypothetical protein